ncbi:hypothetical protein Q0590_25395 [Rhodocytophaga aerolata]|uniref:ATP-binding protein n=1 Tax=Rhodocytophaga aerolata TaxID=455078 RepID=A0ABT8REM6_9BACT|nr:hypothetical protein [Rhodocytophaga aerolata]MDO1449638.1 hypothetical protein [Rhodocytophaga aerolata]
MNENIPQLATIRIECNEPGTAMLFFPGPELEYIYVFTAKHCLTGKNFDKAFVKDQVILTKIFNPVNKTYHTCRLTESDIVVVSADAEDLALIILPKQRILELNGTEFHYQIIDTNPGIISYNARGFASFNDQEADRPFPLTYVEDQKDNPNLFLLKSESILDTYFQRALDNVEGLSGSGAFAELRGNVYLAGIIHSYEDGNIFTATKVLAYNQLIDASRFTLLSTTKLETDQIVLDTFKQMESNREEINSRTNDTIGTVNIPRDTSVLNQLLSSSGMAVIHGKPGVGKSALAKSLVKTLKDQPGTTVITFTPEQLYYKTLPEALQNAGYIADLERILSSPLAGNSILIWIESFEKLIESGLDGAFRTLLTYVKTRPHLMMLVTIRDYSLQKFKINYRFELPAGNIYYRLQEFNEQEINKIRDAIPEIGPLLTNPKIHYLLRTPYYLDKAVRILPELLSVDKLDEIEFKRLMWQLIVEAGNGERGKTFSAVCLKRAREMSLFTTSAEPPLILQVLVRDNMLQQEKGELANRYSPSHDILEDWALVRDIKQRMQDAESPQNFIISLENTPAGNRAFRLWLDEYYKNEPQASAEFVHTILLDSEIDQSWKDILLIATLRSDHAGILFDTLTPQLLADQGKMLLHVINLLETGCKTLDHKHNDFDHLSPVGSGWDYLIKFIRKNLELIYSFKSFEFTILHLIESWSKQLPEFNPATLPVAASDAAFLLANFIERYQDKISGYHHGRQDDSILKKYAAILFKLTAAAPEIIKEMVHAAQNITEEHLRWKDKDLLNNIRHYAIDGVMSDQICKYFPEKVASIATEEWKQKEKVRSPDSLMSRIQKEPNIEYFGLDEKLKYDYDFPSGYQSFFYWMFLHHPAAGLDFLIPFLNTAFERNYQIRSHRSSEVKTIAITFIDGTTGQYYACYEYWVMYRGTNSRNHLITSLLMALEKGLLDLADASKANYPRVQQYLTRMIKETNHIALLGIVSSLIQAHPDLLDETSVSLLGIRDFFIWDASRATSEMLSMDHYNDDPFNKQERVLEDKRIHRRKYYQGLVGFVADYMFYHRTFNELLFQQVDAMWEQMPEGNDIWRKFLFDMDARKYSFKPIEQPGYENLVQLVPGYDSTVQEMMSSSEDNSFTEINTVWAMKIFNYEEVPNNNYEAWKTGYKYIQQGQDKIRLMTSPGAMAAIGLRDFSDRLTSAEVEWCQQVLLEYAEKILQPKDWMGIGSMAMDEKQAMMGLSCIFAANPTEEVVAKSKEAIFRVLVSQNEEPLKIHLEAGMTQYLSKSQPDFLRDCWHGILAYVDKKSAESAKRQENRKYEYDYDFDDSFHKMKQETESDWLEPLVQSVVSGTIQPPRTIAPALQKETHWLLNDALRIIPYNTNLPRHHEFTELLLQQHLYFLGDRDQRRKNDFHNSRRTFTFFYPRFLLTQPQDLAAKYFTALLIHTLPNEEKPQTDEFNTFIFELIQEHIRAVNGNASVSNFWALWEILKQWMITQSKSYLMPLFLMGIKWNGNSDKWHVLDGKNLYYKDFILKYGFNRINESIKFLSGIAFRNFMPDSLSWVASMLTSQKANEVSVEEAEKFIQKAFYNYGATIKGNKTLLNDFIFILDFLIAKHSTKAYMLKEELIQYKQTL